MNYCSIDFGPKLLLLDKAKDCDYESTLSVAVRELAQLNYRYLHLIIRDDPTGKLGCHLRQLSEPALLALSESIFSFFTVAFDDVGRWTPLFAGHNIESESGDLAHDDRADFVETVVFFAWHLACADEVVAKAILQLDERIAMELRRLPIGRLRTISSRANELLAPRWLDNDFFWSTLIRCSRDPSGGEMQPIKLLGRQLLAAESLGLSSGINSNLNSSDIKTANHRPKRQVQRKVRQSPLSGTLERATG
jgi:hypothetical protein